jgi:DNA (cytosine-5)-methyltransferase 1
MVTVADFFCGAGGSSSGLDNAGAEVVLAVNHWKLAIETHSTNHPGADHRIDDIQESHPSIYPRTDILWMSPSCTSHSIAKGRKRKGLGQLDLWGEHGIDPTEERSRATMREVVEFTAYHQYSYVIVENVVDIRNWMHYADWWQAMMDLGYEGKVLYLNSQFFNVPQSRDRYYAVFWRRGMKRPDLDFRPSAWCATCQNQINAVQVFKKTPNWGRYGTKRQYTYRCPTCGHEVHPVAPAAASVIDWTDLGERIGDRKNPLKPKTLQRIHAGIKKFSQPFIAPMRGTANPHDVFDPLTTIIASAQQQPLITQPFVMETLFTHSDTDRNTGVEGPLRTLTSRQSLGFVCPPYIMSYYTRDDAQSEADAPLPVITTEPRHSLVVPPMLLSYMNQEIPARAVDDPLYTIAGGHNSPLVIPPFLTGFYSSGISASSIDAPVPTIMGVPHHGLVVPFLTSYYGNEQSASVSRPMHTVTGTDRHAMVNMPLSDGDIDEMTRESFFRMLKPQELKRGMSFDADYIILGNQRDQTKQIGNAVTPNVAQWIAERVLEAYRVS